jgi:PTS system cellobiose-specific IIB component
MRAAAAEKRYECIIEACAVSHMEKISGAADVILLGPQVKYELENVREAFPDIPAGIININDYGRLDGAKVLEDAVRLMKQ